MIFDFVSSSEQAIKDEIGHLYVHSWYEPHLNHWGNNIKNETQCVLNILVVMHKKIDILSVVSSIHTCYQTTNLLIIPIITLPNNVEAILMICLSKNHADFNDS